MREEEDEGSETGIHNSEALEYGFWNSYFDTKFFHGLRVL